MGAGGQMSVPPKPALERAPHSKPPFTLADLKKAIPPHCFQRSLLRSLPYLVYDLAISALFYYIATAYFHLLPRPLSLYVAWPLYILCQGCIQFSLWVIAHECGHQAFSNYQWLNDTIGLIIHSVFLTPYFSWKISHRRHHLNIASLEYDEVYVPKSKTKIHWYVKYTNNPLGRVIMLFGLLAAAWPSYLAFNFLGRPYERFASHFDPYSPIYSGKERAQVLISDVGILAVLYGAYRLSVAKGLAWAFGIYGGPVLVVNGVLILITYLHHTHPSLPHYDSTEWDWLRGALSTVDRDYGFLNTVWHNVTDTHVLHHLLSTIPHYHAMEATKAIKPILGKYYQFDGTPIYKAVWREAKECLYVENDEGDDTKGVFWYKNKI